MVLDRPQWWCIHHIETIPRDFRAHIFRGFLRTRNSEGITKQRAWMRSALLWAARTYVRISDNERRGLKARETNRNNKEKVKRHLGHPAALCRGVRKYLINGRQSVSLFKQSAMTDLHLRAGGTSADRRQWDEKNWNKIGRDSYVCLAQWPSSVDISYAISFAGFSDKCCLRYRVMWFLFLFSSNMWPENVRESACQIDRFFSKIDIRKLASIS